MWVSAASLPSEILVTFTLTRSPAATEKDMSDESELVNAWTFASFPGAREKAVPLVRAADGSLPTEVTLRSTRSRTFPPFAALMAYVIFKVTVPAESARYWNSRVSACPLLMGTNSVPLEYTDPEADEATTWTSTAADADDPGPPLPPGLNRGT